MGAALRQDRCTQNDCARVFADSAEQLRSLAETLTGEAELGERVLKAALDQAMRGADRIFQGWMVSWTRRLIVIASAEIVKPWTLAESLEFYPPLPVAFAAADRPKPDAVNTPPGLPRLKQLDALHRFVYVLRAVEGYSRRETSLLLNLNDRLCEWIYLRASAAMNSGRHEPGDESAMFLSDSAEVHLSGPAVRTPDAMELVSTI